MDSDQRVLAVLERWFLSESQGEPADLAALCAGDADLIVRVRALLDSEPPSVRRAASDSNTGSDGVDRSIADDALPTKRLGEYRLLGLLGRGGMGTVFLAEQESLGRQVALKVLDPLALRDSRARLRFRREAEVAAALEHPHIVPIYGVGDEDGYAFIAMKRLSGPGLDALEKPVEPHEVARIGHAIAEALDEAHLSGVIHRDVKPANIILDGDEPYVVDFGLARSQTDRTLTKQGAVPGTLAYMAPELLQRGPSVLDPRIDIYALGATLYELLSGRPPFTAEASAQLVRQILLKEPAPLRLAAADRDLETIVLRALEKDPQRRFASARALADDLDRYLRGDTIESKPSGLLTRTWKLARRHRKATALMTSLVVLATLLLALLVGTELRASHARGRSVELARQELAQGNFASAAQILRAIGPVTRERGELRELLHRAESEERIESLLDEVLAFPVSVDHAELDRLTAEIEATDALRHRPRFCRLALAAAAHHRGRPDAARAHLAALEKPGRAGLALMRALAGDRDWTLPESDPLSPDEHVLTALALLLAGRPLGEQEREVALALAGDRSHRRAHYVRAMCLIAAGEFRQARLVLDGLVRDGETPRCIWRNLASCMIATSAIEEARATLARIPEANWTPLEAHVRLRTFWSERDWEGFERQVAADLKRWPAASPLLRAAAEYEGLIAERYSAAFGLIAEARRTATDPINETEAETVAFLIMSLSGLEAAMDGEISHAASADDLITMGLDLLADVSLPDDRARVLSALGRLYIGVGELGRGLESLRAAAGASSAAGVQARLDHILTVHDQLALGQLPFHEVLYLISEARPHADELLERFDAGEISLDEDLALQLEQAVVGFAIQQNDFATLEARLPALLPRIENVETRETLSAELRRIQETRDAIYDRRE